MNKTKKIIKYIFCGITILGLIAFSSIPIPATATAAQIRQEINITDGESLTSTGTIESQGRIKLDTTKYSGSAIYYFEVVHSGATSNTGTIKLSRAGTSTYDASVAGATSTSMTLTRSSSFTPPAGATTYTVTMVGDASRSQTVKVARIIIIQNDDPIDSTQTQIEIGNAELSKVNTTDQALSYPKYWRYNSDNWDGSPTFYAETTWKKTDGQKLPTFEAKGAFASGIGALTVEVPAGYQDNDVFLLFVESANQAIATPDGGWTEVANSPQFTGTAASAGGVRLAVFYKVVSGAQSSVTVADSGNHTTAIMMNFRGVNTSAPINISAGTAAAANTSMVFPTATTTSTNTLVVLAAAMDTDANSTTTMGTVTNTNLGSITERHDETINSGVGGGLAIATGTKATAGATGTSSATGSTSVTHAYMTIALAPLTTYPSTFTAKLQESDGTGDGFTGWSDKVTIASALTTNAAATLTRSSSFTPTAGRNYRLVSSISDSSGSYNIYNAKIIVDQTTVTKLEPQYLLVNTNITVASDALQNALTKWDSSEWSGVTNTYYHIVDTVDNSISVVEVDTAGGTQVVNSVISAADNQNPNIQGAPYFDNDPGNTLEQSLSAYYPMEGSTEEFFAGSPDGTDTSVTYGVGTGKVDQGADYNGTTSISTFGNNFDLVGTEARSWSFWIKPDNVSATEKFIIGKNSNTGHSTVGWSIFQYGGSLYLQLNAGGSAGANELQTSTQNTVLNDGNFQHFVVTYSGNQSNTGVKFYKNGVSQTVSTDFNSLSNTISNSTDFTIGAAASSAKFYPGVIDEVGIWDKVLNATEVSDLYSSGNGQSLNESSGMTRAMTMPANQNLDVKATTLSTDVNGSRIIVVVTPTPVVMEYTQTGYRFFENADSANVGSVLADQNSAVTLAASNMKFRLRMLIGVGGSALPSSGQSFKLQYAPMSGSCDTSFSGETYVDVSTSTDIAFSKNYSVNNGTALTANDNDPVNGGNTIINQTYVDANNFTNSINAVAVGQDGKWDFALYDKGVASSASYCLRIVKADGSTLDTYSVVPKVTTAPYRERGTGGDTNAGGESGGTGGTPVTGGEVGGGTGNAGGESGGGGGEVTGGGGAGGGSADVGYLVDSKFFASSFIWNKISSAMKLLYNFFM